MSHPKLDGKEKESKYTKKDVLQYNCLRKLIIRKTKHSSLNYNTVYIMIAKMHWLLLYMVLEKGSTNLSKAFKTVMDLEREKYSWMKLDESQLLSSIALNEQS